MCESCEETLRLGQLTDDVSRKMLSGLLRGIARPSPDAMAELVRQCRGNTAMLRSVTALCHKRGVTDAIDYLTECSKRQMASSHASSSSSLPSDAGEYGTICEPAAPKAASVDFVHRRSVRSNRAWSDAALEGTLSQFEADLARGARMLAVFPEDTSVPLAVAV